MNGLELKVEKKMEEEEVKEITSSNVTEEKIEESLNYDLLSEEEKKAVDDFNSKIDINDATEVLQFGAPAQDKISKFSDSILEDVKTKNTGEVGDLLANLVSQIKSFDSDIAGSKKKGFLEYFKEISLYIIAGDRKIEELRSKVLPELKAKAEKSGDQLDIQKVNDMENMITRFEKKIYDLKTTRIISIQMAPQIRLLQNNEAELVEKIQSSITNTIPLWKNQMVLALGINNAKQALKTQQEVSKLTNEMLVKNSETLKQGSIDIAEESEKAIVNIETLQKTNQNLIETLDKVIEIHEQGRIKRKEAEQTLTEIEKELKEKMLEIHVEK